MEQFQLLEGDRTLKASREQINNALSTVRSLSSGTAFPTTNLSDGMLCYRTDHKRLYQLTDAANHIWTDRIAMSIAGTANSADTVAWANIENKPTVYPAEEHTHSYAGSTTEGGPATKADALATPRTINGTPFDGTSDITIINTIAQGGTGATTAENARKNLQINLKTYTSWAQLGLDNTATFSEILEAMATSSTLTTWVSPTSSSSPVTNLELPNSGVLEIKKPSSNELGGTLLCNGGVMYNFWYRHATGQISWKKTTEDTSRWSLTKGEKGYARDTSTGLTIQWGGKGTTQTVTFPKAFTTIYSVVLTQNNDGYSGISEKNTTGFTTTNQYSCMWVAIGYCES